jgi:hypothetical protein
MVAIILYLQEMAFSHKISLIDIQSNCPIQLREVDQFENTETKTRNVITPSKSFTLMLPNRRELEGTCEICSSEANMLSIIVKVPLQASEVN